MKKQILPNNSPHRPTGTLLRVVCIAWLLLLSQGVAAQRSSTVSGRVITQATDGGAERAWEELVGATVSLRTATDTLLQTTNIEGIFTFKNVPQGRAILKISFIGYKPRIDTLDVRRNILLQFLRLRQESKQIDQVVVKGKVPLMSSSGDTVIYNAAAVPVLAGDETIRIIEQLPGAEVTESGVKMQGEQITRSYLNGKLIFGDDPMSVLANLQASEVVKIQVYDEPTDNDRRRGYKNARKQKVFNIVTRHPIISSAVGQVLTSCGADIDKGGDNGRQVRYGAGTTSNFFSEKLLLSLHILGDNIGRNSNRMDALIGNQPPQGSYNQDLVVSVGLERYWKDRVDGASIKGGYSYKKSATENLRVSRRNYFATDSNPAMEYSDTTSNQATHHLHKAFVTVDLHGLKSKILSGLRLESRFSYRTDQDNAHSSMSTLRDQTIDKTTTRQGNATSGYSIEESLSWNSYLNQRLPSLRFTAAITQNDGNGWRVDSLSSTASTRVLESAADDRSQRYDWEVGCPLFSAKQPEKPEDRRMLMLLLRYAGSYEESRKEKLSLNVDDPLMPIDTLNTMNYTYNYLRHDLKLSFSAGRWDGWIYQLDAGVEYALSCKDERFPELYGYRQAFISPDLSFSVMRNVSQSNLRFGLTMRSAVPSIEQITSRIDDTNPLFLSAGNPNLKAAQGYDFVFSWNKTLGLSGESVGVRFSARYTSNAVTTRSRFFSTATTLPDWGDYTTQANATLSTYENVSGNAEVGVVSNYAMRLGRHTTLRALLSGRYSRNLAYVGEQLSRTNTYVPTVQLTCMGVLSRKFRYNLGSSCRYSYSNNSVKDASRNLGLNLTSSLEYNPLKWLFVKGIYTLSAQHFYTQTGTDRTSHLLSLLAGCKFYKGLCTLSLSAYDILNRGTSFQSSMQSNYMLESWTPSFGRYFLVNFGFKFNHVQSGKRAPAHLHEGIGGGGMPAMRLHPAM